MADDRIPSPIELLTFPLRLAGEVARLPDTLRALRTLTEDLAATSRFVRETVGDVAQTIEPLTSAVDRVGNIDRIVTELHTVFFAVFERVPGSKRALRGAGLERPALDDAD